MRPKAGLLFSLLGVSWGALLLASPPPPALPRSVPCCGAVEDAPDQKGKGKKENKDIYFVCPIYCYAFWGTHCSYYGEKCSGTYLSLDAECGLPSVWPCDTTNEACVAFGEGGLNKGKKNTGANGKKPHASKGLRKGLMKKPAHDLKPTSSFPSKLMAEGLFAFEYAKDKKDCTIRLFKVEIPEVIIGGTKLPAQTFYHAFEVDPPMIVVHDGKIANGDIDVVEDGGKVCTFQRNGKSYQCIVHNSRKIVK